MTLIRGGPAGPDPDQASGAYAQEVASDRAVLFRSLGGVQGILTGFGYSLPASLSMTLAAGSALLEERDASGNVGTGRGYHAWSDTTTAVNFAAPDVSSRVDAVVICFADVEAGALGSGVSQVGPQVIVVRGVSGTTTPRTDAQINAAVGRGGWIRYADVRIDPGNTQVQAANVTPSAYAGTDGPVGIPGLRKTLVFTASGTFTKATYPWLRSVRVRVQGAGGASGGCAATGAGQFASSGAGGGGGYAEKTIPAASLAASETVTVGAAGTPVSGNNGNAGGSSSFGAWCTGNGGAGGGVGGAGTPPSSGGTSGAGGTATGGDVDIDGQKGDQGFSLSTSRCASVRGGDSVLGKSGPMVWTAATYPGTAGTGFGAGGASAASCASQAATAGIAGQPGVVIVELYE